MTSASHFFSVSVRGLLLKPLLHIVVDGECWTLFAQLVPSEWSSRFQCRWNEVDSGLCNELLPNGLSALHAGSWHSFGAHSVSYIFIKLKYFKIVFKWSHGLVVRTLDSESSNPSSNLGGTFSLILFLFCLIGFYFFPWMIIFLFSLTTFDRLLFLSVNDNFSYQP